MINFEEDGETTTLGLKEDGRITIWIKKIRYLLLTVKYTIFKL